MRDIKTLLQLMLDNQQYFSIGLCNWSRQMYKAKIYDINDHLWMLFVY